MSRDIAFSESNEAPTLLASIDPDCSLESSAAVFVQQTCLSLHGITVEPHYLMNTMLVLSFHTKMNLKSIQNPRKWKINWKVWILITQLIMTYTIEVMWIRIWNRLFRHSHLPWSFQSLPNHPQPSIVTFVAEMDTMKIIVSWIQTIRVTCWLPNWKLRYRLQKAAAKILHKVPFTLDRSKETQK